MGIFGSFKKANQVIEQSRRDVSKKQQKDELANKRNQKNQGKK